MAVAEGLLMRLYTLLRRHLPSEQALRRIAETQATTSPILGLSSRNPWKNKPGDWYVSHVRW
jgi:hypothetical protein